MMNQSLILVYFSYKNLLKQCPSQLLYQCHQYCRSLSSQAPNPKENYNNTLTPASSNDNNNEKFHGSSSQKVQSSKQELVQVVSYGRLPSSRRKTEILRMDPSEYENTLVGKEKLPLLERRGEWQSVWKHILPDRKHNHVDLLATIQADIDLRPVAFRRLWASIEAEHEIKQQAYDPKRNRILGNELAAAHFLVFRKGKVKFLNQSDWITKYRTDVEEGDEEKNLRVPIREEFCTLPTRYEPKYRIEALDASGVPLLYNGLANLDGLRHISWASFRNMHKKFDDWCLDRIFYQYSESLEYLDLSGCTGITERGLAAAWKLKYLKTLVVEDLSHIKNLEIVCCFLEEKIPGLTCIGVNYEQRIQELKNENEEFERKQLEKEAELELNTISVTPRTEAKDHINPEAEPTNEAVRINSKM